MSVSTPVVWQTLERWSPRPFVLAGLLWAGDVIVNLYEIVADAALPGVVFGLFILGAFLANLVGALGYRDSIADTRPWLAQACALLAGLAGLLVLVNLAWLALAPALGLPTTPGTARIPPQVLGLLTLLAVTLSVVSFGIASVIADPPSSLVGGLLLGIVAVLVIRVLISVVQISGLPSWSSAAMAAFLAGISVAIWSHLGARIDGTTTVHSADQAD
jgi:hypothetical protein